MFERTIEPMSPRSLVVLVTAAAAVAVPASASASRVLVMDGHGAVHARSDRLVPPAPADERVVGAGSRTVRAVPRAARARTPDALRALLDTGAIDQPTYDRAVGDYNRAVELAHKLAGARRVAMAGVVSDLEGMAARGAVTAARLPALLATLEANSRWWATGPLLSSGARVGFTGSGIVWQHYVGHGIQ
ncbi:MAG: hypothetical protein QOG68_2525, partial [Solirubrobacteraceae bacterium]|nr:hypothetical protein [Solirubrobacteraceae bacterium]